MSTEAQIEIRGFCPSSGDQAQFREAASFIASTVESVMSSYGVEAQSFDPDTGEPFHPIARPEIVDHIKLVSVMSPAAMIDILTGWHHSDQVDGIMIDEILVDTADV